jgi:hypothetical protein
MISLAQASHRTGTGYGDQERGGSVAVHIAPATVECAYLAIPLVFGEVLHLFSERFVFSEIETADPRYLEERVRVAHLVSAVRLPTRAQALACVAAALHMAVGMVGLKAFPNSFFLHSCQRSPALGFLWGVVVIALLAKSIGANRELFRQEHNSKCAAILHGNQQEDWRRGATALNAVCASARWRQLETVIVGWVMVYTALAIALIPAVP